MAKLSIIIVSYNVRFFLEECLFSVQRAIQGIDTEVWVVDNYSADNSMRMVKELFPWVKTIENSTNEGFSQANNRAIVQSNAEYVLLLNPDTVVQEDSFRMMLQCMDRMPQAGALGVKMIDGAGRYLPESKRGLPTPFVAFCKMSGLTALFPHSSIFARYYMGHLDANLIQEVAVLSGACMLLRQSVLQKVGLLDETFFMYGEDVDLSYRITQAGYKNIYYPHTTIIHYKGKSTRKASFNYSRHFYNAMLIFTRKHQHSRLMLYILQIAIALRGLVSMCSRLAARLFWPAIDWLCLFAAFCLTAEAWAWYKFGEQTFRSEYFNILSPAYASLIVAGIFFGGGYSKPIQLSVIIKGIGMGILGILAFYAFSPEWLRFSRVTLLAASIVGASIVLVFRAIGIFVQNQNPEHKAQGIAVIGLLENNQALRNRLISLSNKNQFVGMIHPESNSTAGYIGSLAQITELVRIHHIDTLLFCSSQIAHQNIITSIIRCGNKPIRFLIVPPSEQAQELSLHDEQFAWLYPVKHNAQFISRKRSQKRSFDILLSLFLLTLFPLWMFVPRVWPLPHSIALLFYIIIGKRTWIGYRNTPFGLPRMTTPVIDLPHNESELLHYTQQYSILNDFRLVFKYFMQNKSRS